jgi:hypothetical protein
MERSPHTLSNRRGRYFSPMNDQTMEVNEAGDDDLEENTTNQWLHLNVQWSRRKRWPTNSWVCRSKESGSRALFSYLIGRKSLSYVPPQTSQGSVLFIYVTRTSMEHATKFHIKEGLFGWVSWYHLSVCHLNTCVICIRCRYQCHLCPSSPSCEVWTTINDTRSHW